MTPNKPTRDFMLDVLLVIISMTILFWMFGCTPATPQEPTPALNYSAAVQAIVDKAATPKKETPTGEEKKATTLESLSLQVLVLQEIVKSNMALTMIGTYGGICGRKFEAEEDQEHCQVASLSCAIKSMEKGSVDMEALMRCGGADGN